MPWPFGPDDMGGNAGEPGSPDLNRHGRRLKWRKSRQRSKHEAAPAARKAANPVLFETYEPRVLLSGAPVGTVLATSTGTADFQDADDTKVTATLTGPGQWQVVQGAVMPTLIITGTDASSTFSITGAGGNGRVNLEGITLAGPMASFTASTTDPVSRMTVQGAVQTIVLGNVRDMVLGATAAIGSVTVESWQTGGVVANGISAPSLGSLASAGQLNMSMTLTSLDQALGSVLAGSLSGGLWQIAGDVGSIAAGSVNAAWSADVAGRTGTVATSGNFAGSIATSAMDVLAVGRNFVGGRLIIGGTLGADGLLGGTGADADSFAAGYLGQLRVAGAMIGARVYVGVDPVNGVFDDGDDVVLGGSASRIQTLMVGGRIDSASRIVTGMLPPSFFAGGKSFTPATAPRRLSTTSDDTTRPTLSAALLNDTGPSATDGITADPSVAGSVSDAGGIVALRGGLDGTPAGDFVDLVSRMDTSGGFALSATDMADLAGGTLAEGPHVLHLVAVDAAGNTRTLDLRFTFSNTQITAGLANDTGGSASDGISTDYAVSGKVTGGVAIATALVGLNKAADTALTLGGDGSFSLSKAQMDVLAGGSVGEGAHVLHLSVTDTNGITTARDVAFTYDATAPKISAFGLTQASDTGTLGDNITAAARVGLLGTSDGGGSDGGAVATMGAFKALVGANGAFQFADVVLADGDNTLKVTVADAAGNSATTTVTINRSGTVAADASLTWNQATLEAARRASLYPETATRILAMVGIAQFDTLAAIEGTAAYLVHQTFAGPIDTQLALAKAAHTILYASFPNQRGVNPDPLVESFDETLAIATDAVADGAAKTNALALGEQIAQAVLDIRASDGSANYVEYLASDTVGRWRPTAPTYEVVEMPQWAELTPFAMTSADQFQLPPPPDLTSAEYAASVNETKELGAANSATRTADQFAQAQFWSDGRGSYTPPGHWIQIAQQIAQEKGNSLAANVRLFAMLNVALADTAIAAWNTKFAYSLWRPIDAIQNADLDGNAATDKDEAWQPLLITPPHPEYVSGHSSFSAAAAAVLQATFGDTSFTTTSYTFPGTRSFTSFQQAVDEAGRSRIYGGIHYEFSNAGGQALGAQVAGAALARFNLAQDTQGPSVVASILPGVTSKNVTVTGQVIDNLSGVAEASYTIDGGPAQALVLDAQGRYAIPTAFVLDGTADALHTIRISAKDAAGNDSKVVERSFRLDTRLPELLLTGLAEGGSLTGASRLTGVADPTGSTLSKLTYSFDKSPATVVSFDGATGTFDAALNLNGLDIGAHTLTVTATDAGGNAATLTRGLVLSALAPFRLTSISPANGETNVGTTERPEIRFSRAVKPESLTSESFYATAADGTRLTGSIVPAQDGSYAWLFLDNPMPGGATVTVHVDGAIIRAAADGAFLDADLDGNAGGLREVSFTTVSLTIVPGTVLRGRVVDPGDDLQPMTFDDMRRGPDGIIHTPDDVFRNPIEHAKVYILGMEDRVVYTNADGTFELTDLPAGNVKVAIDGRTATNAPTGVFWPEMVMDSELRPGEVNTVMDTMGSEEERTANAGRLEVYLPRVQTTIFSVVSDNAPTTVGVDQNSAPNLTDSQRSALTLTVDPGSIIGEDGQPLSSAQVGISTVPPELVRDMLPPGVLQHTFDITIQAPGAATFTTPATITFPNVFGSAPGTKLNILSFDHTTGMLVINGTATVSEDGLTVVSDEGAGVRAPGWHGITPPGGCNPSGGAPPDPVPPSKDEKVTEHAAQVLTFLTGSAVADNFKGFSWTAPAENKAVPPLPPIPGCEVPPHNPDTKQQPFISVTIEVDGALGDFAKPVNGSLDLKSQSFTLSAGTGITKKFDYDPKTYAEMFTKGNGFLDLTRDQLYGAKVRITEIRQNGDGSRTRDIYTYYEDRWIDVVHAEAAVKQSGATAAFLKTLADGKGNFEREKLVDAFLPSSVKHDFAADAPFTVASGVAGSTTLTWKFDPEASGNFSGKDIKISINDGKSTLSSGTLSTVATGLGVTKLSINLTDKDGFYTEFERVMTSLQDVWFPSGNFDAKTYTYTGKPGVDGVDDDKNGVKDDASEYGWPGSDDVRKTLYFYTPNTMPTATLPGADGKLGTKDDQKVYVYDGSQKTVTFNEVSAAAATELAAFMPNQRGAGADGIKGTADDVFSAAQLTALHNEAIKQGKAIKAAVIDDYKFIDKSLTILDSNAGADLQMTWQDLGGSLAGALDAYDSNRAKMIAVMGSKSGVPDVAQQWAMSEYLNNKLNHTGQFSIGIMLSFVGKNAVTFAEFTSIVVDHELAHGFGLNEGYYTGPAPKNGGTAQLINGKAYPYDIMGFADDNNDNLTFKAPLDDQLRSAVGMTPNGDNQLKAAVQTWRDNFNLVNGIMKRDGIKQDYAPAATGPDLLVTLGDVAIGGSNTTATFDTIAADGAGAATSERTFTLSNVGIDTLDLSSVALASGGKGFSIVTAGLDGTSIAPDAPITVTVRFDPAAIGPAVDTLVIKSNGQSTGEISLTLRGTAIPATASVTASSGNNNFGGMTVGSAPASLDNVFRISNAGATALSVTAIRLVEGGAEFSLLGVPADLKSSPISLDLDKGFSFGIAYAPTALGLQRAVIEVETNDPSQPVLRLGAVGTGVTTLPTVSWGNDYVGMQVTTPNNPPPLNEVSDDKGFFTFFLPNSSPYHMTVFDPATGLVSHDYGKTAASGKGVDLTATLVFGASVERDSDYDGLPDDVEFAIGSNPRSTDTNKDGVSDFTAIRQGLSPLGDLGTPTGIVGAAAVKGEANGVAVIGSATDPTKLTAFVATGSAGLAVVDVSKIAAPTVLSELDLAGENNHVVVDGDRGIAAISGGSAGLHLVNVATPASATLIRDVTLDAPVASVALRDGIVYAATGANVSAVDINTGDVRTLVNLATLGGAPLVDLAVNGDTLFTLDNGGTVRAISIDGDDLSVRGQVSMPQAGSRITVGGGVAYIAAYTGGQAGFMTADVKNLDALAVLSGVDNGPGEVGAGIAGSAIALTGTGRAVMVGGNNFVFGAFRRLDVVNVTDPTNTGATADILEAGYDLPQIARDVTIANGIAFVADAASGLQIVNYLGFDTKGVAPTVTIDVAGVDADPGTPGIQILAGSTVHITPTVADDVQVRNVELLVNGKVVSNDPSYPFDMFAQAPTLGSSVELQVRVTDTGGNVGLSDMVSLATVPDTFGPNVVSTSVNDGDKRFFVRNIDVRFNERVDASLLTGGGLTLVGLGADGTFGTADDVAIATKVDTRAQGRIVSVLPAGTLLPGDYRLQIAPSAVADLSGNHMTDAIVRNFTVRPASDVKAATGVPEIAQAPSANPGQEIGIAVPFDPATAYITFATIDNGGTAGKVDVKATRSDGANSTAYFVVPANAYTGDVVVYGKDAKGARTDFADGSFPLQVVPLLTGAQIDYLNGDGTMRVTLFGRGFVEGNGSVYSFGSEAVVDTAANTGPEVSYNYTPDYTDNSRAFVTVPISDGAFGAITVKTAGGTSTAFGMSLGGITATAMSGTAKNAGLASANAGQAITLTGTGLTAGTKVVFRHSNNNSGETAYDLQTVTAVSPNGTSATVVVPSAANGVFGLQVLGASEQPALQIVPKLQSYDVSNSLYLYGSGFVEAGTTYTFAGAEVKDTATGTGPDVESENTRARLDAEPAHGFGPVTVATAGGTSAPLTLNELTQSFGNLRDIAYDPATKTAWVVNYPNANPSRLHRLDLDTGAELQSISLNGADFGSTQSTVAGLQITTEAFTLGLNSIPAGSLLMFNGDANPDRVIALDPTDGKVLGTLTLKGNYDLTAGIYDPTSNHLFLLDRGPNPRKILEVDPADGTVLSSFNSPLWGDEAGLAIDPVTDNLWMGSYNDPSILIEMTRTGTEVRRVNVGLQGINDYEISGLAFDGAGKMLVSSTQGRVYTVDINADVAAQKVPTLTGILGTALGGLPADAAKASTNVGQVVTLTGTNFGAGTQVVFPTRNGDGLVGAVSVVPLAINDTGTQLQVVVPDLATTGDVRVSNAAYRTLGGNPYNHSDAIYRAITLNFTASAATATIRFADGGLQNVDDESWGIDNVSVRQGKSVVFADNFEAGASKAWSNDAVNRADTSILTAYSGRFSNNEQRLSLSGLAAGQSYTLTFDLYALDSWDGAPNGDTFQVTADGQLLMRESISNYSASNYQTINSSAGARLQVVPTLTGLNDTNLPGTDYGFVLRGTGLMDGASKITIGGVILADDYTNPYAQFDVYGSRNDYATVYAPLTLEGPVKVTTEGGSAEIALLPATATVVAHITGIAATAASGTPSNAGQASANVGQTIVLNGSGFTSGMRVVFAAMDDTGRAGIITRGGVANAEGTQLSVEVPALARTGVVRVVGAAESQALQIVPTLRGMGGTVAPGNTLLVEGTGLVPSELVVQAGGRTIGNFTVRTIGDSTGPDSSYYYPHYYSNLPASTTQQLLTIVLPAGVSGSAVSVSTVGGSALLRSGITTTETALSPPADAAETLATAIGLGLPVDQILTLTSKIGDGANADKDVDLYRVDLNAGETLRTVGGGTNLGYLRLFNDQGKQLQSGYTDLKGGSPVMFVAPTAGAYFVGVSLQGNYSYDPTIDGSGNSPYYTSATYTLSLERLGAADSRLTGISASAALGTPAQAGVASANTSQSITLLGVGLAADERVVFSILDENGSGGTTTVTPTSIAADGTSLVVVVPVNATTGSVRLERDSAGQLLQVVPTLSALAMDSGTTYNGGSLVVSGTGFAEGRSSIAFGARTLADLGRNNGIDIASYYDGTSIRNGRAYLTVPNNVPTGPIRITTPGGTSNVLGTTLATIAGTAGSGIPADAGKASANTGQSVTFTGTGLSAQSSFVFETISTSGVRGQVVASPWSVNEAGTSVSVQVPATAVTGTVRLVGDTGATALFLQVVPKVTAADMSSVDTDGGYSSVSLSGTGFVEGNGTEYRFGSVIRTDNNPTSDGGDVGGQNDTVSSLRIPLGSATFGAITVKTEGGTSAPFSVTLAGVTATALSGTPADAKLASANPGQLITLTGAGFDTGTDIVFRRVNGSGDIAFQLLHPVSAAPDGTSAVVQLPMDANGVFGLQVLGAAAQPMLQIVPTLQTYDVSGSLYLYGSGFVEGGTTFTFAGAEVKDTLTGTQPDIYGWQGWDSGTARLDGEPVHGLGNLTITTAGGTSAPFTLNELTQSFGNLRDVAYDPATKTAWVVNYPNANPSRLHRLDLATGAELQSISLNGADFGSTQSTVAGLQITTEAFTLGLNSIPAGSLLMFNGDANPDRVIALDPTDGKVLGTLTLKGNYDLTAGIYDPTSNHLFLLDRGPNPRKILEVDPADGTVLSSFNSPLWGDEAGLAIDPVTDNLWMGSYNEVSTLVEMTRTGTEVRRINLASQGINDSEISGLAFDEAGKLLVSSTQGRVYRVDVGLDNLAIPMPTLTSVSAAAQGGVPADAGKASANTMQVITLTGTNFGPGTRVLFPTVNEDGASGVASVAPLQVNPAGTVLQVQVPAQAATGLIKVTNGAYTSNAFGYWPDAAFRGISLSFTASSATSVIRFNDLGLEGRDNESWGLDNVFVTQGKFTIFSDNFQKGANAAWSEARIDTSLASTYSAFSGRFSSEQQLLTLNGLTAGQTYNLAFDLYAFDSLDGEASPDYGRDVFQVSADGKQLMSESIGNYALTSPQTINSSAGVALQIVPTLTGTTGRPGTDNLFTLAGSGFIEGASTIQVGGVSFEDSFADYYNYYYSYGFNPEVTDQSNRSYQLVAPLGLDGPIRVTTAGGYAEIPSATIPSAGLVQFNGLLAVQPTYGSAADPAAAAANVGQTITLVGSGFTSSTLVQFEAVDASGTVGTITRQGQMGSDSTRLTIRVPAEARSGQVRVIGAAGSYALQVVPWLRGVGGTIAEGNTLEIDGSGFVPGEVGVAIDGIPASVLGVTMVADGSDTTTNLLSSQQILRVSVPAGTTAGEVTLTTNGGHGSNVRGGITVVPAVAPVVDVGGTLADSTPLTLGLRQEVKVSERIGSGSSPSTDVDLYRVDLGAGDQLQINLLSSNTASVRVFDAAGTEKISQQYAYPGIAPISFTAAAAGAYYVGISGYSNYTYDPTVAGSGTGSYYTGKYEMAVLRQSGGDTRLSDITSVSASGTPATAGVASANPGQTITVHGTGLTSNDDVVFLTADTGGYIGSQSVHPSNLAVDGTSFDVVVPTNAITGTVRLLRDPGGLFLQVVPVLSDVTMQVNQPLVGGNLQLTGKGFVEGATVLNFGADHLADISRSYGFDVYGVNSNATFIMPPGLASGPISVTTAGGTSSAFGLTVSGLASTAGSGTPADAGKASANPGQTITLTGTGFDSSLDVVFMINNGGTRTQTVVRPTTVAVDGTSAEVVVPNGAETGVVRVVGDSNASEIVLQIVPVVTGIVTNGVNNDTRFLDITLQGKGFIDREGTQYRFGTTPVEDPGAGYGQGPDTYNAGGIENGAARMGVPIRDGSFGPIVVRTEGGTSAPFSVDFSDIAATATSGAPADPAKASANPGQDITVNGTGLTTALTAILRYRESGSSASVQHVVLHPTAVADDGMSATITVPTSANGAFDLWVVGSDTRAVLQVVPTVSTYDVSNWLYLYGSGFVEGGTTFTFAGAEVNDTSASAWPDIDGWQSWDNGRARLDAEPVHGIGDLTITTAGGTSAPFTLNEMTQAFGNLRDIAYDPTTKSAWVVNYPGASPSKLHRLDIATGAELQSITLTTKDVGSTQTTIAGLQVTPEAFTLGAASIPVGSLLFFNGEPNADRVIALNPADGTVLGSLTLKGNYDLTAGIYDPTSNHLFLLDRSQNPRKILEIDPADGTVLSSFNSPLWGDEAGLAIDPVTDNLWMGSYNDVSTLVEMTRSGTEVRRINLASQGINDQEISGLAFDSTGKLLVSSTQGRVYRVTV